MNMKTTHINGDTVAGREGERDCVGTRETIPARLDGSHTVGFRQRSPAQAPSGPLSSASG